MGLYSFGNVYSKVLIESESHFYSRLLTLPRGWTGMLRRKRGIMNESCKEDCNHVDRALRNRTDLESIRDSRMV